MKQRKHRASKNPRGKVPDVDYSHEAYRGYSIRKNALTGDMWIEKGGFLIARVPSTHSWSWARKEIDALLGPATARKNPSGFYCAFKKGSQIYYLANRKFVSRDFKHRERLKVFATAARAKAKGLELARRFSGLENCVFFAERVTRPK